MAVIFGSDAGIRQTSLDGFVEEATNIFNNVAGTIRNAAQFRGPPAPPKENVHVDTGFANVPGTSFVGTTVDNVDDIKQRHIISQEPNMTVYIKKRAFSGLKDENDSRFMDDGEKLFMRASKILFEKKCNQVGAYEALTKLSKLVSEDADLDALNISELIEIVGGTRDSIQESLEDNATSIISQDPTNVSLSASVTDSLTSQLDGINSSSAELTESLLELQKRQSKLRQATNTNWVIDPDTKDKFNVGRGAGVIELTLVSSANTSLGIEHEGRVNLTIQDPYNLMKITNDDVEISISAAQSEKDIYDRKKASGEYADLESASILLEQARSQEEQLRAIRENKIASAFGFDRTVIGESKVAEIIFEINPTSSSIGRVVAYTTDNDTPFDKNNFRIALANRPVEQQLTIAEDRLVTQIFELLERYVDAVESLNKRVNESNQSENIKYVRRQMRKHYLGKSIVQPMDGIHIYMRSNTVNHTALIGPLNYILNHSMLIQSFTRDIDVSDAVIQEEMKQFGLDELNIPMDLYKSMRTGSFMRNAGTHVFGGLVSSVSESYNASSGTYTLNVDGESNLKWLNLSRVNTRPSLVQPKGMLEDPLTPFKFEIDSATGLIKNEPELLDQNKLMIKNKLLRDRHGVGDGVIIDTENDLKQDQIELGNDLQIIWKHAPGMVYKWKEGVSVVTYDVNLATSLQGSVNDTEHLKRYVGLNIVEQPFAGLDAADIVSLLITGFPHSASKFYEVSKGIGTFTEAGSNASPSYFRSFFDITRSTNAALGNFQPFRHVELEGTVLAQRLRLQQYLKEGYTRVDQLRSELATNRDKLIAISARPEILGQPDSEDETEIKRDLAKQALNDIIDDLKISLDFEIAELVDRENKAKQDGVIKDTSNIVFRLDEIPTGLDDDAQRESNKSVRLKNKILQLRTQYDCKFNVDQNLFVVSDKYDNDREIQAFVRRLKQQQNLFNSEYQFPLQICREVTKVLDFELFCDTQGHLQFRPPQYNRVPLSLILKMFLLNTRNGTQLYPDFLVSMFQTKLESVENELDNIDAQIKIDALSLNLDVSSEEAVNQIQSRITDEDITGNVYFTPNTNEIGTSESRVIAKEIVKLSNQLEGTTGRISEFQDIDKVTEHVKALNDPTNSQVNSQRLNVANRLSSLVGRRQQVATLLKKLRDRGGKFKEQQPLTNFSRDEITDLLAPFQDLIEDDLNDFLGPGSSKRFIIYDDQIISYNFTESDQNAYCRVDVNGEIDFIGNQPGEIAPGLPSVWAGATDFDMWRQYGYRSFQGEQNKPFLKDAADQCAPYALFLLARAKRDIVKGTITVAGNEYYQLGDVVYINSRDMLFYVTGVKHTFSYESAQFTTTLDLRYGHTLGDYIPTPLDVIGKQIIRDQKKFNRILVSRETVDDSKGIHIGMVVFEDQESDDEKRAMLSEPNAKLNISELKRSLLIARNNVEDGATVEVRGWINSEDDRSKTETRMTTVTTWLKNPRGRYMDSGDYIRLDNTFYDAALQSNHINNDILKSSSTPVRAVNLGEDLSEDDTANGRLPNDEVFNASVDREPYNIIEIVLIPGEE